MSKKAKKTKESTPPDASENDVQNVSENETDDISNDSRKEAASDTQEEMDAAREVPPGENNSWEKRSSRYHPRNFSSFTQKIATNRSYQIGLGIIAVLIAIIVGIAFYNSSIKTRLTATDEEKQQIAAELADAERNLEEAKSAYSLEKAKLSKTEQSSEETEKAMQSQIADLEATLQNVKSRVGNLKDEKKEAMIELAQFKRFSKQFQRMVNSGKLEVDFRRGRMVVNLPAQVLFDSGSAELTEEGETALKDVAKILRTVRNRRFMIGGHTDNQKIVKADFDSNWELASARAIVVTKALIKAGLPPKNLVAAGYSQYAPIASNASDAGRQKNRRIEIILEPFLKDITPPVAERKSKKAKTRTAERKGKKKGKKVVKAS